MSTTTDHSIETAGGVSLAEGEGGVQGADVRTTRSEFSANGLSLPLLDERTMLAAEKVRNGEGLRLMGEGGMGVAPGDAASIDYYAGQTSDEPVATGFIHDTQSFRLTDAAHAADPAHASQVYDLA